MKIKTLNASFVNNSYMDLNDAYEMHEQLIDMFEDKIEDYTLLGSGEEVCLALLGDDTGAPLSSMGATFEHKGNFYYLNIPGDDSPVEIKIKLSSYDKNIAEVIAIKNLEASFKAKEIKIIKVTDKDYKWLFEVSFKGIEYRSDKYSDLKRIVNVHKESGNHVYEN